MPSDRLQEPSFLILSALAGGPMHGYAVLQEVGELSRGSVRLRVGTLYGALDRLAGEGLVAVDREEVVDSRLRRYYRLTGLGAERLEAEALRSRRQAEAALRRLRRRGSAAEGAA
ncbi:PadR family transcriptional regulator [Vallicoccus soli]|uniref:PadR family transcriptional regulator n=1 Tax=Vallicoccus soli TaxID=2339232 RepID=A0A3A3YX36_9ACTN|nr:PadR family transcriptional regulator [Vallicoccus soli]RJK96137.1 PadR family transcriptional regulator [Vallicoccus soli]